MFLKSPSLTAFVIIVSIFGAACSNESSRGSDPAVEESLRRQAEERNSAFADWDVVCENFSECPSGVGQLVFKDEEQRTAKCTAFLVNDGQNVVTNSHCAKTLKLYSGYNQAVVVFPQTSNSNLTRVKVAKVIADTEKKDFYGPDLAILELVRAVKELKAHKINRSGTEDNAKLKIAKVDPSGNHWRNLLKVEECRAVTKPFFFPGYRKPLDATIALTGCEIVGGNSGSPLFDPKSGEVKAVAFGHLIKDEFVSQIRDRLRRSLGEEFGSSTLDHPDLQGKQFNLATNAACLSQTATQVDLSGCTPVDVSKASSEIASERKEAGLAVGIQITKNLSDWAIRNSDFVVWRPVLSDQASDLVVDIVPLCVQPIEQWGASFLTPGLIKWNKYQKVGSFGVTVPSYKIKTRYDNSLRIYLEPELKNYSGSLNFNPRQLAKGRGGIFKMSLPGYKPKLDLASILSGGGTTVKACGKRISSAEIKTIFAR